MTLIDEIVRLFERACAEGDLAVAEKLLQALEVADAREVGVVTPPKPLARAYLAVGGMPITDLVHRGVDCKRRH